MSNSNPFNIKNHEQWEYVQLPKHLYDAVVKATSREEQEKLFFAEIEERKLDLRREIENLEEDVLRFKAIGIRYKNELSKIYEAQYEKLEKMWDSMNLEDNVYSKLKEINSKISSFDSSIGSINYKIKNLNAYNLEKVIGLLERFNSFSESDKEIIKYLLEEKTK